MSEVFGTEDIKEAGSGERARGSRKKRTGVCVPGIPSKKMKGLEHSRQLNRELNNVS